MFVFLLVMMWSGASWGCPIFDASHSIEIWYIEVPLLETQFGHLLGEIGLFHAAIELRNIDTGLNCSAEYYAYPSFIGALLPEHLADDSGELQWKNLAGAFVTDGKLYESEDRIADSTRVANLDGDQANALIAWVPSYNVTFPKYQPFSVFAGLGSPTHWIKASTCDDFAYDMMSQIYAVGGSLLPGLTLERTSVELYSTEMPSVVPYYTNTSARMKVNQFYSRVTEFFNNASSTYNITKAINDVLSASTSLFYLYNSNEDVYYSMSLVAPYSRALYREFPVEIPSGTATSSSASSSTAATSTSASGATTGTSSSASSGGTGSTSTGSSSAASGGTTTASGAMALTSTMPCAALVLVCVLHYCF